MTSVADRESCWRKLDLLPMNEYQEDVSCMDYSIFDQLTHPGVANPGPANPGPTNPRPANSRAANSQLILDDICDDTRHSMSNLGRTNVVILK